jgi:hypothetical protein
MLSSLSPAVSLRRIVAVFRFNFAMSQRLTGLSAWSFDDVPERGCANEQALIYGGLGDKDRTLGAIERVATVGAQRIGLRRPSR